jgi:hypothetical protein
MDEFTEPDFTVRAKLRIDQVVDLAETEASPCKAHRSQPAGFLADPESEAASTLIANGVSEPAQPASPE